MSIDTARYVVNGIGPTTDPSSTPRTFDVFYDIGSTTALRVGQRAADGALADGPFSIAMFC
jgi:hypothetical protein